MLNLQSCSFRCRILCVLFSFLLFLSFCLAMTSCGKDSPGVTVQLWASEDDPLYPLLVSAIGDYNRQLHTGDLLAVSIRSFSNEEKMISALSSGSPDLVLCSHYRQDALEQMDRFVDIAPASNLQVCFFLRISLRVFLHADTAFSLLDRILCFCCSPTLHSLPTPVFLFLLSFHPPGHTPQNPDGRISLPILFPCFSVSCFFLKSRNSMPHFLRISEVLSFRRFGTT